MEVLRREAKAHVESVGPYSLRLVYPIKSGHKHDAQVVAVQASGTAYFDLSLMNEEVWRARMAEVDNSMTGKTCLVTGATAGIGQETARELARLGATVIIVGRNPARCEATVVAIQRETGNPHVEFLRADMSSQAEIRRLAREFHERRQRLHVLVNNAGALFTHRCASADGIEMTFALNHLGYFLLTRLLLDTLKASAPARIVNVSSDAHKRVEEFDFAGLEKATCGGAKSQWASELFWMIAPWKHPALRRYCQSKLANMLFTYELARRLPGTGVTVNAVNPGYVATNITAGNGLLGWIMRRFMGRYGISAAEGALPSVYLATAPELEGVTGQYFMFQKSWSSSLAAQDEATARRLWQLSEELTEAPGVVAHGV
jgi:retinol dehydrogenase 12